MFYTSCELPKYSPTVKEVRFSRAHRHHPVSPLAPPGLRCAAPALAFPDTGSLSAFHDLRPSLSTQTTKWEASLISNMGGHGRDQSLFFYLTYVKAYKTIILKEIIWLKWIVADYYSTCLKRYQERNRQHLRSMTF